MLAGKFSKVSALVVFLWKVTVESTLENACLRERAQCVRAHVDVAQPHSVHQTYFVALVCVCVRERERERENPKPKSRNLEQRGKESEMYCKRSVVN